MTQSWPDSLHVIFHIYILFFSVFYVTKYISQSYPDIKQENMYVQKQESEAFWRKERCFKTVDSDSSDAQGPGSWVWLALVDLGLLPARGVGQPGVWALGLGCSRQPPALLPCLPAGFDGEDDKRSENSVGPCNQGQR